METKKELSPECLRVSQQCAHLLCCQGVPWLAKGLKHIRKKISKTCSSSIVAVRLGEAAGLSDAELRDAYYEALLRYIGCNADTYWLSSMH